MELPFLSFPFFFSFLLFLFTLVKIVKRPKANNSNLKLPPGPRKLPFIGNMHQLSASLPHHSLRNLAKKHGPMMHLQLGEVSTIVVSSKEMAKEVLKTHDLSFAQRPRLPVLKMLYYEFTDIGFAPYGNYWRQMRKICTIELLSAYRILSFRSIREEEVSNLIKTISTHEGSQVNLSEKIFSLTYDIISRVAFGKKYKDQYAFISIVKQLSKLAIGFSIADLYPSIKVLQLISRINPKLVKLHQENDKILGNIINDHRESRRATKTGNEKGEEDLVDVLLKHQEHDDLEFPLTDSNIKAVILVSMLVLNFIYMQT